mgnify:CR=1 FL=1
MPDVRSGDIVEISYQETFESDQIVKYRAYVLGVAKKNSLMSGLIVAIRIAGVNLQAQYPINSPKVKNMEIVARGAGTLKSRLYFLWDRGLFTKSFIQQPWKGRSNRLRKGDIDTGSGRGRKSGSLVMDYTEDDSVRKVL